MIIRRFRQNLVLDAFNPRFLWWLLVLATVSVGSGVLVVIAPVTWLLFVAGAICALVVVLTLPGLLVNMDWLLIGLILYLWLLAGRADRGDILEAYPMIRWGSYMLIPCFLGLALIQSAVQKGARRRVGGADLIGFSVVSLIIFFLVSAYVNGSSLSSVGQAIGTYLRYPMLFLALSSIRLAPNKYRRLAILAGIIAGLLVIEAIMNFLLFNKQSDGTFFTLGVSFGTLTAGLLWVYALCFLIAHALWTRFRWYHLSIIGLVAVASSIATIRSILIVVPVLWAVMWWTRWRFGPSFLLYLFAITITLSAFLLFLVQPMMAKLILPHLEMYH